MAWPMDHGVKTKRLLYVFWVLVFFACGCTRKLPASSALSFTMPPHPNISEKAANQSLSQSDPDFCYYLNVTGSGITQVSEACAPTVGINSGFLAPSSLVSLTVPLGTNRTVELYGYIAQTGQTCASLAGAQLKDVPVNRLFRMASRGGVDTTAPSSDVTLTMVFPGLYQHYGLQAPLAANCYANLPPIFTNYDKTVDSSLQVGTHYSLKGALQSGASTTARGTNYQMVGGTFNVAQ